MISLKYFFFPVVFCLTLSLAEANTLPPCPGGKPVETWNNCIGTYIDSIGGKYVGGWKDGKFHGQGTTTFSENSKWAGDKYTGGWKDGKKYGQGTYTYADESSQEGIWFNDQFLYPKKKVVQKKTAGQAVKKNIKPKEEIGDLTECPEEKPASEWTKCIGSHTEFKLEKIPPQVRVTAINYLIDTLETDPLTVEQVINDLMTGILPTDETNINVFEMLAGYGGTYVGAWKDGEFHGKGITTFGPKTRWAKEKYEGFFKNGERHGKGTYIYSDGSKYVGDFFYGKWHGKGTLTNSFGDKYVCQFKDGKRHGHGKLSNKNGETYIGIFKNDIATGQGTLTYKKNNKK